MKAVIQRAKQARVVVEDNTEGKIDFGLVVLLGVSHDDTEEDAEYLAKKIVSLRIFEDEQEKMNLSLQDVGGSVLSISQFTLYADTRKGRRPNFLAAAKPDPAKHLYGVFNQLLEEAGTRVETGVFGADMQVHLTNDGPVTLILDSSDRSRS
ncbi:D-aminoacyl-tRNA deacylase [Virgibacillus senegalensis]|uniref:D-aminoacyl-tRNA deacylase n=1 Tax=Virgibacillus senegalensis TaxID=1499679 RepID=UPI00069D2A35|nr:D-aminoacyl-tRNA deacylase [Virgibacillus senegalensis]